MMELYAIGRTSAPDRHGVDPVPGRGRGLRIAHQSIQAARKERQMRITTQRPIQTLEGSKYTTRKIEQATNVMVEAITLPAVTAPEVVRHTATQTPKTVALHMRERA